MNLGEEYRWNVPVVTYGFDQSFLDYFGSNGIAAIDSAIKVINALPPASVVALTNFSNNSQAVNYAAQGAGLSDLKSATLAALIEHLGLAQPTRYILSIRKWSTDLEPFVYVFSDLLDATNIISNYLLERNFDPKTLEPTPYVNGTLYNGYVYHLGFGPNDIPTYADVREFPVDPLASTENAVADNSVTGSPGAFYTGLTFDDMAGLAFLLSTNRLVEERVLPGVQSAVPGESFVNAAVRPGVDKITFIPHPRDGAGGFQVLTNFFTDSYVRVGQIAQQQLARVVDKPDFLFVVDDTGRDKPQTPLVVRSDASEWINNAGLNASGSLAGPGIIAPPVKITFHRMGGYVVTQDATAEKGGEYISARWGSFDQTTNWPMAYPDFPAGTAEPLSVRLRLNNNQSLLSYTWQVPVPVGGTASLQTSTNLSDWAPVMILTNNGGVVEWFNASPLGSRRYFRVTPQ